MKPYKLYRDRDQVFECQLSIDGASISKTKARILLESNDKIFAFNGNINKSGKCKISIPNLDSIIKTNKGDLKLEVIAENTIFKVWKLDHGLSLKASQGSLDAIKPAKNLPAMDRIISMVS